MNSGRVEVAFATSHPTAFLAEGACISWYQVTVCEPVAAGRRTGARLRMPVYLSAVAH